MQFDLSAVETGTLVFVGTLMFAVVIAFLMSVAACAALVLAGVARVAWLMAAATVPAVVRGVNLGWDRLTRHATSMELAGGFRPEILGQQAPSTGTYPRVVLRDS